MEDHGFLRKLKNFHTNDNCKKFVNFDEKKILFLNTLTYP